MKVAGSNLWRIFCVTPRCLLVQCTLLVLWLFKMPGGWVVKAVFESCQWLYSVYTNNKFSHPSYLSCVLAVAPTIVQPKTTRFYGSITVITLWGRDTGLNWPVYNVCTSTVYICNTIQALLCSNIFFEMFENIKSVHYQLFSGRKN